MKRMQKRINTFDVQTCIVFILLLILGFSLYFNSLDGQFVWDDNAFIRNNKLIRSFENIPVIFSNPIASGSYSRFTYYRPLVEFSYMVDYHFWKLNVLGYHITNIFLHAAVSLGIFILIRLITGSPRISFITALLFIIHPIHTGSVCIAAGRAELLVSLFMLAASIAHIKDTRQPQFRNSVIICCMFLCALFSKENALMVPFLMGSYHFSYRIKGRPRNIIPYCVGYGIFFLFKKFFLQTQLDLGQVFVGTITRIPGFFHALSNYFRLLVIPTDQHFDYGSGIFPFTHPIVILGMGITALLIILSLKSRRQYPIITFGICWFLISLMPYSNLYPLFTYMAEHFLYLPSIGYFVIMAYLLTVFEEKKRFVLPTRILLLLMVIFYGGLTVIQNYYWCDPIVFYKRTLTFNPNSYSVYNNLGTEYSRRNEYHRSIYYYTKALELQDKDPLVHRNLASSYIDVNDLENAKKSFLSALAVDPNPYKTYNGLGIVYRKQGKYEQAADAFKKSLKINPAYSTAAINLGGLYRDIGDIAAAKKLFADLITSDPYNHSVYFNVGLLYGDLGKYKDAIGNLTKAIELNPQYKKAYYNRALFYEIIGKTDLARESLRHIFRDPRRIETELDTIRTRIKDSGIQTTR